MILLSFVQRFQSLLPYLALGSAFLIPLKLSLAYICLVPFALIVSCDLLAKGQKSEFYPHLKRPEVSSLLGFYVFAVIVSFFGLNPGRSLAKVLSPLFCTFAIPGFAQFTARRGVLPLVKALCLGQAITSLHSVLEAGYPEVFNSWFLGKVTESGQLSLTLVFAAGLCARALLAAKGEGEQKWLRYMLLGGAVGLCGAALGFSGYFTEFRALLTILFFLLLAAAFLLLRKYEARIFPENPLWFLILIGVPLMSDALLVNLKRGPWLGVAAGLSVFLLLNWRKVFGPMVLVALLVAVGVGPVRDRLASSSKDFFISGGRNIIWDIGAELSIRYPLGIGYRNSAFLKQFSSEIPQQLEHFHNNFLNILVETGWLGLALYLFWLGVVLRECFRLPRSQIAGMAIGCAIISWQVAGLVEYNFGDSEVVLIAYVLVGMLLGVRVRAVTGKESSTFDVSRETWTKDMGTPPDFRFDRGGMS